MISTAIAFDDGLAGDKFNARESCVDAAVDCFEGPGKNGDEDAILDEDAGVGNA